MNPGEVVTLRFVERIGALDCFGNECGIERPAGHECQPLLHIVRIYPLGPDDLEP
jgi:hypothetical protein